MAHEAATTLSLPQFKEKIRGKRIVLLYPWTNYRSLFLAHYYDGKDSGLLYYRIMDGQATLAAWLESMVEEFSKSVDGFGSNLRTALKANNATGYGEALAADLAAHKSDQTILYIDELDRLPFDANFEAFMRALASSLPENCQVVFNSRLLHYQPWYDMVVSGLAVVLGTERRKDDVMLAVQSNPRPQLEVYALGRGYALANGQFIDNWDGALPRNLFFYFVDRPLVTRREIFETFWPDLPVKEATNVFHVTKRKISERISMKIDPTETFELTQYGSGFYTPSTKLTRHYDAADFQADVEQAMASTNDDEEERLLLRAIEYYKAPFLQDTDMPWIEERREQLRLLNGQALIGLGRLYKRKRNDDLSLGYFTRALRHVPEREDIQREVMSIYLRQGRKEDALNQYLQLVETLRSSYDINPARETQDLYHMIENS
ncbi:MAG: bacterial transcriptional activator domain-containing protein [Anaerolineae bacterium]